MRKSWTQGTPTILAAFLPVALAATSELRERIAKLEGLRESITGRRAA